MWRKIWNSIRAGGAYLHDLGECEVKHGVRIGLANLYDSEVGNAQLPKKLQAVRKHRTHVRWAAVAIGLLVVALRSSPAVGCLSFFAQQGHRRVRSPLPRKKASRCFRLKI